MTHYLRDSLSEGCYRVQNRIPDSQLRAGRAPELQPLVRYSVND